MPNDSFLEDATDLIEELSDEVKEEQSGDAEEASSEKVLDDAEEKAVQKEEDGEPGEDDQEEADDNEEEEDLPEELPANKRDQGQAFSKMRNKLKEAEKSRKATEAEMQKMKESLARLEGATEATKKTEPVSEKQEEADVEPDKDIDPDSWRDWKIRQQDKTIEKFGKTLEKEQLTRQEVNENQAVALLEKQYRDVEPAYDNAVKFIMDREKKLIKLQRPELNDQQIDYYLSKEKVRIFKGIYEKSGKNPGEVIMKMADVYGYKKADGDAEKDNKTPGKKPNLANLKNNMKKNTNLIGGTKAGATGDVDPEVVFESSLNALARKSDGFFNKAFKTAMEIDNQGS